MGHFHMLISWMLSWGDIPLYNLTTLCLNGTLPYVDFMDVIMGDALRMEISVDLCYFSCWTLYFFLFFCRLKGWNRNLNLLL